MIGGSTSLDLVDFMIGGSTSLDLVDFMIGGSTSLDLVESQPCGLVAKQRLLRKDGHTAERRAP
jgi:hypothetical protein